MISSKIILDDVGKRISLQMYNHRSLRGVYGLTEIKVLMVIVAPNGDRCAIFDGVTNFDETRGEAVRSFVEGHR